MEAASTLTTAALAAVNPIAATAPAAVDTHPIATAALANHASLQRQSVPRLRGL